MLGRRRTTLAVAVAAALALTTTAPAAHALASWTVAIPQPGALDATTPRSDGQVVIAARAPCPS